DVIPVYMESCTMLPMEEVERVRRGIEEGGVHPMDAKKRLAWEIVRMYHSEAAADAAQADFEQQFQHRGMPAQVPRVWLERAISGKADEAGEVGILDLLINVALAPSRKHAQRLVEQGGVHIDDERIANRDHRVRPLEGMVIKAGRSFVRVEG